MCGRTVGLAAPIYKRSTFALIQIQTVSNLPLLLSSSPPPHLFSIPKRHAKQTTPPPPSHTDDYQTPGGDANAEYWGIVAYDETAVCNVTQKTNFWISDSFAAVVVCCELCCCCYCELVFLCCCFCSLLPLFQLLLLLAAAMQFFGLFVCLVVVLFVLFDLFCLFVCFCSRMECTTTPFV